MTISRRLGSASLKFLLIAAVVLAGQATLARPATQAAPATPVAVQACTNVPTGIWPAGDSITEGLNQPTQDGYRGHLFDMLNALSGPCSWNWRYVGSRQTGGRNMVHDGWGGKMINEVASHIPVSFGAVPSGNQPAQIVLWNAGTNDTHPPGGQPDRNAQQMIDDTRAAMQRIHLAGPEVKVLLQQITITTVNTAQQQQEEQNFDDRLPALAAELGPWVQLVDMRGVHTDGIHPYDDGYLDMAGRIKDKLVALGWTPGSTLDKRLTLVAKADWQYVCNSDNGGTPVRANRITAGVWERWQLVDQGNGDVALWSDSNGRYVAADNYGNAPLIANRTAVGPWERFQLVTNTDGSISLRATINGRFVSADAAGNAPLIANRDAVGDWEKFFRSAA